MMMRVKETARIGLTKFYPALPRTVPFLLSAALLVASGFAIGVVGQETQPQQPAATKRTFNGRDPFRKYEAPPVLVKRIAGQANIPSIQDRIALYKAQKQAAM